MSIQPKYGSPVPLSVLLERENVAPYRNDKIVICGKDSFEALNGGLYVCVESNAQDALASIRTAQRNGAIVAVVANALEADLAPFISSDCVDDAAFQTIFVDDPRSVYARACQAFYGFPANKMRVIAITGTAGKTSLSYILGGVLAESGRRIGLVGSLGLYDGQKLRPLKDTTPEPEELAKALDDMYRADCACVVLEVSSVALAEKRIAGIEFDAVCLTNLRRDHLDIHRTVDQYRRVKMQIFSYLKKSGVAVCNLDDRVTGAALHAIECPTLTVGIQPTACSVSATPIERSEGEQTFYLVAGSDAVNIRTTILGNEHIYNCLEAAALGLAWKIDLQTIARGIERVKVIPGRMERVDCGQPFGVYLDRANSPDSLNATLETLRQFTRGKLYCVLSCPADADRSKRPLMGHVAEKLADRSVVTAGNHLESQREDAFEDMIRGFVSKENLTVVKNRKEAIETTLAQAEPDDCVLIVGQDVSTLDKINESFVPDRQFIKHWLYENQPCAETSWYN